MLQTDKNLNIAQMRGKIKRLPATCLN